MNTLFVFSDQQRHSSLGAYGNSVVQTPNLDRMAAEGMVCESMFSNHPLCSPFRAILLTGRYGWKNGVIDNEYEPFRGHPHAAGRAEVGRLSHRSHRRLAPWGSAVP